MFWVTKITRLRTVCRDLCAFLGMQLSLWPAKEPQFSPGPQAGFLDTKMRANRKDLSAQGYLTSHKENRWGFRAGPHSSFLVFVLGSVVSFGENKGLSC